MHPQHSDFHRMPTILPRSTLLWRGADPVPAGCCCNIAFTLINRVLTEIALSLRIHLFQNEDVECGTAWPTKAVAEGSLERPAWRQADKWAPSALARSAKSWHHCGEPLALGDLIHGRTRPNNPLLCCAFYSRRDVAGELRRWRGQLDEGDGSGDHDATFKPDSGGRPDCHVFGGRNRDSALELSVAKGH